MYYTLPEPPESTFAPNPILVSTHRIILRLCCNHYTTDED